MTAPAVPSDLVPRGRGRRFWRAVTDLHDLRPDEVELLAEACRQLDLLDQLRAAGMPLVVDGKINPTIVEARQVRIELRRTLAQLHFPDLNDDGEIAEPTPSDPADFRTYRARKAARARWDRHAT